MSAYSLQGYLAAVLMRGVRSIIVEGVTDRRVLARLVSEVNSHHSLMGAPIVIDTTEMIYDSVLPASRREMVEYIYQVAIRESSSLAALVDREWRRFRVESTVADDLAGHYSDARLFWTRGHSIENYFFNAEDVVAYLRMKSPETISEECLERLTSEFESFVNYAAALSIAAMQCSFVEKCSGLCEIHFWKIEDGSDPILDVDSYVSKLTTRGVPLAAAEEFGRAFVRALEAVTRTSDPVVLRWFAHGHIAWNVVWAAVGRLVEHCGAPPQMAAGIGHGFVEEKKRFLSDRWAAKAMRGEGEVPSELISWILSDH